MLWNLHQQCEASPPRCFVNGHSLISDSVSELLERFTPSISLLDYYRFLWWKCGYRIDSLIDLDCGLIWSSKIPAYSVLVVTSVTVTTCAVHRCL